MHFHDQQLAAILDLLGVAGLFISDQLALVEHLRCAHLCTDRSPFDRGGKLAKQRLAGVDSHLEHRRLGVGVLGVANQRESQLAARSCDVFLDEVVDLDDLSFRQDFLSEV